MPDRMPLISGNWKMHHNHFEAIQLIQKLSYALSSDDYRHVDVSVHPPFTDLRSVQTVLQADDVPISLGAQNVHHEEKGAFTGEGAPGMLQSPPAGIKVEREIHRLSTYLGHGHVNDTYWYLEAVPELLELVTQKLMEERKEADDD